MTFETLQHNREYRPEEVVCNVLQKLQGEHQEVVFMLMLNDKNEVLEEELIAKGTMNTAAVQLRDIFQCTLKHGASRIILMHNHPSGDPTPSEADILLTDRILEYGDLLGITLIDHIIIGGTKRWSWREECMAGDMCSTIEKDISSCTYKVMRKF